MNTLHGSSSTWVGDSKEGAVFGVGSDNEITINGGRQGTPFHIRLDNDPGTDYYFQLNLLTISNSFSVGVVTPSESLGGWKTNGMFYNGNLTNGSAALITSWGPGFGPGDDLGVRVSQRESSVEVVFYKNGQCLGSGFRLADNDNVYYPCISVDGEAKLTLVIPSDLPSKELQKETYSGFDGHWKLVEAVNDAGVHFEIPPGTPITLQTKITGDDLSLRFKVGNQINGSAKIVQESGLSLQVEGTHFMSTRMMPPPILNEMEHFITGLNPETVVLQAESLVLSRGDSRLVLERLERTPQTLTSYRN